MLLTMNSKELGEFLESESDKVILKSDYVIISTRIRLRSRDQFTNVANLVMHLFPDSVMLYAGMGKWDDLYYNQLEQHKSLLARLVLMSEKEGRNVIFLCTKDEEKLKFMKTFRAYIKSEFGCPIYGYTYYTMIDELDEYDQNAVVRRCERIIKVKEKKDKKDALSTQEGRDRLESEIEKMSRKELKKKCKKKGLYVSGMSKDEMIGALTSFLE